MLWRAYLLTDYAFSFQYVAALQISLIDIIPKLLSTLLHILLMPKKVDKSVTLDNDECVTD